MPVPTKHRSEPRLAIDIIVLMTLLFPTLGGGRLFPCLHDTINTDVDVRLHTSLVNVLALTVTYLHQPTTTVILMSNDIPLPALTNHSHTYPAIGRNFRGGWQSSLSRQG